nr:ABC transporter G family member 20-like [Ipomoea trifida]
MSQASSRDDMSTASDLPFLGPRQAMELQELTRRPRHSVSMTLGELLHRVGDSAGERPNNGAAANDHRVLQLYDPVPYPSSFPFVLSFHNLSYSVKVRRKMAVPAWLGRRTAETAPPPPSPAENDVKVLLDDISGEAREGEIMAVLGASGSGKSTLIDALANRIARESLGGTVKMNGEILESKLLKVISAYVMQDDLLFPMLTVEETLMFSAEFRLPRSLSRSRKKARVQALIEQLGLQTAAKTVIGDEGHRGVSGGERRRVSIGIDIIHDPIVLFLDEPTSGLDSTSAFMVVKVLQRIAQSGSIVIMSIHQPSYRILSLLDRLIFLSKGQTVFSGSPSSLPRFFQEFGNPIPENENRCEFALDFIRELEQSSEGTKNLDAISASISRGKLVSGATNINSTLSPSVPKFANPFWVEMVVIGKRSMVNSLRMPELFAMRFGAVVVTGIILATIFWKLDDSPKGIQERLGFFAFAMSTTFYTCAEAIPVFLQERYIFMRETAYNAYRRSSYVLSHSIISLPSLALLSFAFAVTTYCGFFINRDRIPPYWIWFHYASLVKYPFQGVLQNEFDYPDKCFVKGIQIFDGSPLKAVPEALKIKLLQNMSKTLGINITSSTCLTTGPDILKQTGVTDINKWNCLWITIALGFFFRLLFYFALLIGSKNKRR